MKLLPRYDWNGDEAGYFDPTAKCVYRLRRGYDSTNGVQRLHHCQVTVQLDDDTEHYLSPRYATEEEGMAELDRIAALIGGTAPAHGWVKGAPPKDGQWYVAIDPDGDPVVVRYAPESHAATPWQTATHFRYATNPTHHQPTPIEAPKES